MSKKIGEINLDGAVSINTAIEDLFDDSPVSVSDVELVADDEYVTITPKLPDQDLDEDEDLDEDVEDVDESDEDVDKEEDVTADDDNDSENFSEYSNAALLALSLKDADSTFFEEDINKDLNAEQLLSIVKESIEKEKASVRSELETTYGEVAQYIENVLNGMSGQELQAALYNKQIGDIELTGDEEEDTLVDLVKPWLIQRGTPESDVDDVIQVFKDKGTLLEKAQQSITYHKNLEKQIIENHKKQREQELLQAEREREESSKKIKDIIKTGTAKGMVLNKSLEDAIFKPTEIVEGYDNQGRRVQYRVPLVQKRQQEFMNDPEQQVAFMQLLANNFDFSALAKKEKARVNNELLNAIDKKGPVTRTVKQSNYFSD